MGIPDSLRLYTNVSGTSVGYASGWVQFETDGNTFRYEATVCRQSGYALPSLSLYRNAPTYGSSSHGTYIANITPSYGSSASGSPCYSSVGTSSGQYSYPSFDNVRFLLVGGTFDYMNGYVTDEDYNRLNNPY